MEYRRRFLAASVGIFIVLVGLMLLPYIGYIVGGLLLGFLFYPLQKRLEDRIGASVSAFVLVVLTFLLTVLPVLVLSGYLAGDIIDIAQQIQTGELELIENFENQISQYFGVEVNLGDRIRSFAESLGSEAISRFSQAFSMFSALTLGLTLMVFTEFYSLKQGRSFLEWTKKFELFPTDIQENMYTRASEVTIAVLKGHLGVVLVEGVLLGLGFLVFGLPNPVFWGFIALLLGFIPVIGIALVYIPASIYLSFTGSGTSGVALFLWGLIVTSFTDDILRPYLVSGDTDIHPFLVIAGVIGGIHLFGFIGVFLGPIILGVGREILEVYLEEHTG